MREFYNKTYFLLEYSMIKLLNVIFRLLGRFLDYFKNEDVELFGGGGGGGGQVPPLPPRFLRPWYVQSKVTHIQPILPAAVYIRMHAG